MDKSKIIKIVVIVAIVGIGAYILLTGGKIDFTGGGVNISKSVTTGTFSGSLKAAVEKGIPLKCTVPKKSTTTGIQVAVAYLKGKKYYAEITQNGKQGYIIMVDNCMWSWFKETKQGGKICFGGDIWEQQGSGQGNFDCKTAIFSDSLFTPPADVKFIDADQAGGGGE